MTGLLSREASLLTLHSVATTFMLFYVFSFSLSCCIHTTCSELPLDRFFIIMSPAEGLHFSALVCLFVTSESTHLGAMALPSHDQLLVL